MRGLSKFFSRPVKVPTIFIGLIIFGTILSSIMVLISQNSAGTILLALFLFAPEIIAIVLLLVAFTIGSIKFSQKSSKHPIEQVGLQERVSFPQSSYESASITRNIQLTSSTVKAGNQKQTPLTKEEQKSTTPKSNDTIYFILVLLPFILFPFDYLITIILRVIVIVAKPAILVGLIWFVFVFYPKRALEPDKSKSKSSEGVTLELENHQGDSTK